MAASSPSGTSAASASLLPPPPPQGWPRSSFAGRLLSSLLCLSNFVGYCLDSVPLARWCQRRFVPRFSGRWDLRSVGRYALISAPAWVFGVLVAVFVGAQPPAISRYLPLSPAISRNLPQSRGVRLQLLPQQPALLRSSSERSAAARRRPSAPR